MATINLDIEIGTLDYGQDVANDLVYLKRYLEEMFDVAVELHVEDIDYTNKMGLAKELKRLEPSQE